VSRDGFCETRPPCLASTPSFALHPTRVLRPRPHARLPRAPPRQARTHRRRVRTAELPEPRRLPSVRPRPCGRSGPVRARFHTCTDRPSTLVACREPLQPRQRSGGRFKLPRSPRPAFRRAARPRRRCFSPMSATDPQNEHPSEHSIPGRAASRPPDLAILRAPDHANQVELRLTATLQLQPASLIVSRDRSGPRPRAKT